MRVRCVCIKRLLKYCSVNLSLVFPGNVCSITMVKSCAAFGCTERYVKGSNISFHSFPTDAVRRSVWTLALKRDNFKPNEHTVLCSKHFSPECFDSEAFGIGRKLKPDAVPSIFDFPPHLASKRRKRKPPTPRFVQEASVTSENDVPLTDEQPPKRPRTFRKSYLGDYNEEIISSSPNIATKFADVAKSKLEEMKIKLRLERQKCRRLTSKISTAEALLSDLKQKQMITESTADMLENLLPPVVLQLLRSFKGGHGKEYPEDLRKFALTLNFFSSRAYDYVRDIFSNALPHPSTLRKWYQGVSGKPGFSAEAKTALILKSRHMATMGKTVVVSLMMDEMSIRKHIEFDGKRFVGYVDCGADITSDNLPEAKDALVFMVVSLNDNWKIPVGYFLTSGLSGSERANLVLSCLDFLHQIEVNVVSLTFDGAAANLSMARYLGAELGADYMKPWFVNPSTGLKVHTILDACHMLKLVRNCLATKGTLFSKDGPIKWEYLIELEKLQAQEGLHLGTKLTKRHINWYKEPMKVKLAAQTFSESVASALSYCNNDLGLSQFEGCAETVKFLRLINNLFDILNSRNLFSKGLKRPLDSTTYSDVCQYAKLSKDWLFTLKESSEGTLLVHSSRRIGFVGLIYSVYASLAVYEEITSRFAPGMSFLLTYKLSQDHLEVFFSAVRSRGGHNNNPTARQFEAAFKRLLVHIQVGTPTSANCSAIDGTRILSVPSSNPCNQENKDLDGSELPGVALIHHDHDYIPHPASLSMYVNNVVEYIAGFVARKLKPKVKCNFCQMALFSELPSSGLLKRKNRGGLSVASTDVVFLCKMGEKILRQTSVLNVRNILEKLVVTTLQDLSNGVFLQLNEHVSNRPPLDNHIHQLKKAVLTEYFKIRLHHEARLYTENLHLARIRSFHTKIVLFRNQ